MKSRFKILIGALLIVLVTLMLMIFINKINSDKIDTSNNMFESFTYTETSINVTTTEESLEKEVEESSTVEKVDITAETLVESKANEYVDLEIQRLSPTGGYDIITINESCFVDYESFINNVFYPNIIACEDGLDNLSGMTLDDYIIDSSSYINNEAQISVNFDTTQDFPGKFVYNKNEKTIGVFYE